MDLQALFVALILPALRGACVNRLRWFRDKEERYALAEGWAWYKLEQWTRQGKPAEPWRVVEAAIGYAAEGRPIPGSHERKEENGPDALDRSVSGGGMSGVADRAVSWEHAAEVAEEYAAWFQTLTLGQRRLANDLTRGMTTKAAAAKYGVSQSRISQQRMELRVSWYAWWNRE